jgi:glycosyltransferase involved in cell wall biosynthesis
MNLLYQRLYAFNPEINSLDAFLSEIHLELFERPDELINLDLADRIWLAFLHALLWGNSFERYHISSLLHASIPINSPLAHWKDWLQRENSRARQQAAFASQKTPLRDRWGPLKVIWGLKDQDTCIQRLTGASVLFPLDADLPRAFLAPEKLDRHHIDSILNHALWVELKSDTQITRIEIYPTSKHWAQCQCLRLTPLAEEAFQFIAETGAEGISEIWIKLNKLINRGQIEIQTQSNNPWSQDFIDFLKDQKTRANPVSGFQHFLHRFWRDYMHHNQPACFAPSLERWSANLTWFLPQGNFWQPATERSIINRFPLLLKAYTASKKTKAHLSSPLKIAHVCSQVVDGGHAPSRLLRSLITHHNRSQFEPSVWVTETHVVHRGVYPQSPWFSPASTNRAPSTLSHWKNTGVPLHISGPSPDLTAIAEELNALLEQAEIDVLACHGHDPIHYLLSRMTRIPIKVFVEHSGRPNYEGFDLCLCSVEGTALSEQERYNQWKLRLMDNPYGVDPRDEWTEVPPNFELPAGTRIITTISNHLESRLSPDFVKAIAMILQRVPDTVYYPMGPVTNIDGLKERFKAFGVENRIQFLGSVKSPSNYCRSMHLYLNEVPFGGGLSIADAMAAGLPVVSMHDANGPMQARNGAAWFGIDWVLSNGSIDDYVNLACSLLENPEKYQLWSSHAIDQYQLKGPRSFVAGFENCIQQFISNH